MNVDLARNLLKELSRQGMKTICLCPGARNAPFVELLSQTSSFETIGFYDERSAGFFALGRARRDQRPVGVVTTSGTAVAELLPAVIEASYSETPLVVVSSDRPKRLRGTGAPQSIEQSSLFLNYVDNSLDISTADSWDQFSIGTKPFHLNVCFDEPLLNQSIREWSIAFDQEVSLKVDNEFHIPKIKIKKPLIVVGTLSAKESKNIENSLIGLKLPIFAEVSSGLRPASSLERQILVGGERIVSQMIKSGEVESVVRIGDVPLGRYWRDLDQLDIRTISFSNKPWRGTEKSELFPCDLTQLNFDSIEFQLWDWQNWKMDGKKKQSRIDNLLVKYPRSEPALIKKIEDVVNNEDSLYIGNSLPVRIWDLVSHCSTPVRSNRGANGIDGQVSSAFGWMEKNSTNWVVLGDLTSLYDFNGFWVSDYLRENNIQVNLIIVNNGGGKIFSRIFRNPLFLNSHQLNFSGVAQTWGWNYLKVTNPKELKPMNGLNLIEIIPDETQSDLFWKGYDSLWA